jgi:hypothetical protein
MKGSESSYPSPEKPGHTRTGLIVFSFAYSLRKRGLIKVGSPHRLLRTHEALASIGALAILVYGVCTSTRCCLGSPPWR